MGRPALAVSGVAESQAQVSGSSVAPSAEAHDAAAALGKTTEILTHPRLHLSEVRSVLRKHAGSVIYGAFPERSRYATCVKAARMFGCSPDRIEAMIEGDTASPDPLILGFCARVVRERTGKPTAICRVLAHIIAAEISA
jgi:hypothetical protein